MTDKPSYEELELKVRELEREQAELKKSEQKKIEQALQKSDERFRVIFETAQDSIFIKDRSLRYTHVNPAMERLFQVPARELIGKRDEELLDEAAGSHIRKVDSRVLAGEILQEEHTKPVSKIPTTFHVVKVPMRDNTGEIVGLCGIARDITERKQAEEALRESERKYRDIFENVSDFLYFHDLEGNFIETNLAAKIDSGYSEDDLTNKNIKDLIPERYKHLFDTYLKDVREKGKTEGLLRVLAKDGSEHILEYRNSLVFDATGPIGVRGSARDVTERKRSEKERENLINELQEALKEIKTLRGILPLCSFCKKIRDDKGYWEKVDVYLDKHSQADISHSICPECEKEHY